MNTADYSTKNGVASAREAYMEAKGAIQEMQVQVSNIVNELATPVDKSIAMVLIRRRVFKTLEALDKELGL